MTSTQRRRLPWRPLTERDEPMSKKVAFLVAAEGVEQIEPTEPWKAVADAGHEAVLVSPKPGVVQMFNHLDKADTQQVDLTVSDARVGDFDALVLPGGVANPDALRQDQQAVALVKEFVASGKPVAAICHAPWMLVEADVVSGRRITSWPSLKTDIRNAGGDWVDEPVVQDGNITTSRKPDDLPQFSSALLESGLPSTESASSTDRRGRIGLLVASGVTCRTVCGVHHRCRCSRPAEEDAHARGSTTTPPSSPAIALFTASFYNPMKVDDLDADQRVVAAACRAAGWEEPTWIETTPRRPARSRAAKRRGRDGLVATLGVRRSAPSRRPSSAPASRSACFRAGGQPPGAQPRPCPWTRPRTRSSRCSPGRTCRSTSGSSPPTTTPRRSSSS